MGWLGLVMLLAALLLMSRSGWPNYAVLLGVSTVAAVAGVLMGAFDAVLLESLPLRVIGLLEHDLLQALVLYALVGALLHHLGLAERVYQGLSHGLQRLGWPAPTLAAYGLGSLLAPMNGSVAASLSMLSHTTRTHWQAEGVPAAERAVLISVISTLGVIVPPSLVLLLLGEAMMRAHTEALQNAPSTLHIRIINTQDILQAVLPAGLLLWLLWAVLLVWRGRLARRHQTSSDAQTPPHAPLSPLPAAVRWTAVLVPLIILTLLGLVSSGRLRAVEAAATAALLLCGYGVGARQLSGPGGGSRLWRILDDTMALSGALMALLVAATTFSLLLRAFGTDQWVAQGLRQWEGHPQMALALTEGGLLVCAFVLDAFELIFLVVPLVMPPLLAQVPDAGWVATLTLLVLQMGFLLPPFGYALVLARAAQTQTQGAQLQPHVLPWSALLRPWWPFMMVLVSVLITVWWWPASTHWLRSTPTELTEPTPVASPSAQEVEDLMRSMSAPSRASPD